MMPFPGPPDSDDLVRQADKPEKRDQPDKVEMPYQPNKPKPTNDDDMMPFPGPSSLFDVNPSADKRGIPNSDHVNRKADKSDSRDPHDKPAPTNDDTLPLLSVSPARTNRPSGYVQIVR